MRFRTARFMPLALAVALIALLSGRDASRSAACGVTELTEGVPYALDVCDGTATFDLAFEAGTSYDLVLGSLDVSGATHTVTLTSEPCQVRTPIAAASVDALGQTNPRHSTSDAPQRQDNPRNELTRKSQSKVEAPARTFFIHVTDGDLNEPRNYVRVIGREIAVGRTVRILLDEKHPRDQLAKGLCEELVRLCDDEIIPPITVKVGPCRDLDGDGRLTILLTPWLNGLQGGRTSLGGFVRSSDFSTTTAPPLGNQGDILYLNATLPVGPALKTLLAHEYTHAVAISARLPSPKRPYGRPHEDDWISEGTAHLAERTFGSGWSNLDYRIDEYLQDPSRYPLVVPDYYGAGLWRCHGCRGATWLFLQWCAEHANPDLLRDLVQGPGSGIPNLERATGVPFEELFRQWSLAVLCSGKARRSDSAGNYAAIDLHGRVGGRSLSGPRVQEWDVSQSERQLTLASTAVANYELTDTQAGTRRIRIAAPKSARLQVTILKPVRPRYDSHPTEPAQVASARHVSVYAGQNSLRRTSD